MQLLQGTPGLGWSPTITSEAGIALIIGCAGHFKRYATQKTAA